MNPRRATIIKAEADGKLVKSAPIHGWFYNLPEVGKTFYMEYPHDNPLVDAFRVIRTSTVQKVEDLGDMETLTIRLYKIHTLNSVYFLEVED